MPTILSRRVLSEDEFNAIKDRLLAEAPDGLDEASFYRWIGPRLDGEIAKAEYSPETPKGSAVGRFVSGAAEMLNPIEMVKGAASAVVHPIDTAKGLIGAQVEQGRKAWDAAREGRYSEAVGHGAAALLPVVGPMAADIGEQIGSGDVAGGMGRAAGVLAPYAISRTAQGVRGSAPAQRAAAKQTQIALDTITRTMAPDVGANKVRFGNMAAKAAPDVADMLVQEGAPFTREGLRDMVARRYAHSTAALDQAADARLSARTIDLAKITKGLQSKLDDLRVPALDGSQPIQRRTEVPSAAGLVDEFGRPLTRTVRETVPLGRDVVPGPHQARAATIQQALEEVQQLGPVSRYEPLRQLRQAYDAPASAVYNPSLTQDFLKAQGGKLGAADVTGVLRDELAALDPATAAANKTFSTWKRAHDVMQAAEETNRVRPSVGRTIMSRGAGALVGGAFGGGVGAAAGALAAPAVEQALGQYTLALKSAQGRLLLAKLLQQRGVDPSLLRSLLPAMAASHGQE